MAAIFTLKEGLTKGGSRSSLRFAAAPTRRWTEKMNDKKNKDDQPRLEDQESGLRSLLTEASGETYTSYKSLAEAKIDPNGVAILEGDYGGQIYVVVRAKDVKCDDNLLFDLLQYLDRIEWDDPDGASIYYESRPVNSGVAGGMGGGAVMDKIWIHPRLQPYTGLISEILSGSREHLPT